jgi:methylmalonyl-CoA/ethylmalonyl-CoA epimerase
MSVKKINHIAIVVPDLDAARAIYQDALGLEVASVKEVAEEEVMVGFLPVGDTEIELLQPTNDTSGVARFMEKRGPGFHHLCFEVDDIEGTMAALKAAGAELINEEPRIGEGGRKYAFVHPKSTQGLMIELYESQPGENGSWLASFFKRVQIEMKAISAGVSAFFDALSPSRMLHGEAGTVSNNRRITLKRSEPAPEETDQADS